MPGTTKGGLKAKQKNTAKDPDFYKKLGALGGAASNTGGFYGRQELASLYGKLGGKPSTKVTTDEQRQAKLKERSDILKRIAILKAQEAEA